ncbi:MAG: formate dehydrogenase accessory protein FdhE [Bacillota bacterium]|nr:formate dehydrogenase accessory protein FdhE [Bacillota bacterium]
MNLTQYRKYQDEIERCRRIYKDFDKAAPVIEAIFKGISDFFMKNPPEVVALEEQDKLEDQIREGMSLKYDLAIKTEDFVELLSNLSKIMEKYSPGLQPNMVILREILERFLSESQDRIYKNELNLLHDMLINETVLEKDLATFLFSVTQSSFHRQHLNSISKVLRTDLWEGGECPLCGEKPHFGILRTEDGAKELECWLCGTSWVHARIKCPFCSNEEQKELGYFTTEESEKCRVNFCKKCCHYYKIFDARKFNVDGSLVLTIHNLATLDYDLLAKKEGFNPGSGLEWINDSEVVDR